MSSNFYFDLENPALPLDRKPYGPSAGPRILYGDIKGHS